MLRRADYERIKREVVGRWPGLYVELGIEVGHGEHGPCPLCGGADRFRMDNRDGEGTWICNQCGAGDGWELLQKVLGCDFKQAVAQVSEIVGHIPIGQYEVERSVDPTILRALFKDSVPAARDNLVGGYLTMRGLDTIPGCLRYHPGIREPETCQIFPAMLAVVQMPDGKAATLHRTFLTKTAEKAPVSKPKKLMPGICKLRGGAVRLFEHADVLGVAEGIETAIACHEMDGIPVWAVVSTSLMVGWEPPVGVERVVIYGDNDANYAGQKAAYILANRLKIKNDLEVRVEIPYVNGDWLDSKNM